MDGIAATVAALHGFAGSVPAVPRLAAGLCLWRIKGLQ
jgi:hypothetical protein